MTFFNQYKFDANIGVFLWEVTFTIACAQSFPDRTAPSIEAKYFCFV